jgi:hypothetical protein
MGKLAITIHAIRSVTNSSQVKSDAIEMRGGYSRFRKREFHISFLGIDYQKRDLQA